MKEILGITEEPRQKLSFVLEDNSILELTFEYRANVRGWFYSLSNNEFILNNKKLVSSPNMLRKYRNIIDFGIAIVATDGLDPAFVDDFSLQRIQIYVLEDTDLDVVENEYYGG